MVMGNVTAQDILDVEQGQRKLIPLRGGRLAELFKHKGQYRLRLLHIDGKLRMGAATGEGAAAETP